ncbi:MAG: alternative ribosome rescue aminoacyl-tRNA hydrolase ArfB [Planctomycetota bacterium]|jgi:ribosome-associated protein
MTPEGLWVRRGLVIPEDELSASISRSGGPGGQHVNKTSTRVSLRWSVTESRVLSDAQRARLSKSLAARLTQSGELIVHVDSERSQSRNRELARERLAKLVRAALTVRKARRPTKPTKASKRRRLVAKQKRGHIKKLRGRPDDRD